jgi:hydroxymethylbilane synthase
MSRERRLILGTRGSPLALTQSRQIAALLESRVAGLVVELRIVKTEGDRLQEAPPAPGERLEKGLFTSALERALLAREIDLAVHSLKDLPTTLESGLVVAAIPQREDPRDALLTAGMSLHELPHGARVATGSPRRQLQLKLARPDLELVAIRGNVDTRIGKLRSGECHGLVLALAGLKRLGRSHEATEILAEDVMLPAPGQGALGIEMRDEVASDLVRDALDHAETRAAVSAERAVLAGIGGGCQLPLGTLARAEDGKFVVRAVLFDASGVRHARARAEGTIDAAHALGSAVAAELERGLSSK